MKARPVVVRFRRFYRRPPSETLPPQGAGGVYRLAIGPALHQAKVAEMLRELGLR